MEKAVPGDMVEKHLGLVDFVVAAEKRKLGVRDPNLLEDMRSSAMLGLVSAVEKYDPSREASFKAYAELRMKYAIYDGMADFGWFPRRLQRKIAFLRRASEMTYYQSEKPKPADSTEAVHRLSSQLKELATAYITTYVEETKDSGSVPPEAESAAEYQELSAKLRHAVESLPEKQRFVVEAYFYGETRLHEIAEQLGVTASWVSKLLSAALKALREMMESQGIEAGG